MSFEERLSKAILDTSEYVDCEPALARAEKLGARFQRSRRTRLVATWSAGLGAVALTGFILARPPLEPLSKAPVGFQRSERPIPPWTPHSAVKGQAWQPYAGTSFVLGEWDLGDRTISIRTVGATEASSGREVVCVEWQEYGTSADQPQRQTGACAPAGVEGIRFDAFSDTDHILFGQAPRAAVRIEVRTCLDRTFSAAVHQGPPGTLSGFFLFDTDVPTTWSSATAYAQNGEEIAHASQPYACLTNRG